MDRGFYSRTINSPSFSSKFVNLGKKSGTILLNAIDEVSPYLVGGEDKSYFGDGRHQLCKCISPSEIN